jgi:hypothetical protein
MSKSLNQYFTEEFTEFAKKFKVLQSKYPAKCEKIQKTMHKIKSKDKKLLTMSKLSELTDKNQELSDKNIKILASSRNIIPLIKSIAATSDNESFRKTLKLYDTKFYFKSNKPIGNSEHKINVHDNVRGENMKKLRGLIFIIKNLYRLRKALLQI